MLEKKAEGGRETRKGGKELYGPARPPRPDDQKDESWCLSKKGGKKMKRKAHVKLDQSVYKLAPRGEEQMKRGPGKSEFCSCERQLGGKATHRHWG